MLAKKYRLPIQDSLTQKGETINGLAFSLKVFPSPLAYARFGVSIGKKVHQSAVKRNFLKRQIFSWFHQEQKKFPGQKDFLILIKPPAVRFLGDKDAIIKELQKLFNL